MLICPLKISLLRTSDRAGKRYSTVVEGCKLKLLLILHLILIPRQDDPEYLNGLASGPLEGHDIVLDVVWKTHFRCSLKQTSSLHRSPLFQLELQLESNSAGRLKSMVGKFNSES